MTGVVIGAAATSMLQVTTTQLYVSVIQIYDDAYISDCILKDLKLLKFCILTLKSCSVLLNKSYKAMLQVTIMNISFCML
jgi:hypothetical protein